ncbi:MAG: twin-arginine translocase subunit TatC, partial [Cyanobacteria bacterium J06555_12]
MTIAAEQQGNSIEPEQSPDPRNDLPDEVEMTLFEHLEELRARLLASVIAVVICIVACFAVVKNIVAILEMPAHGVTFLQLAPGEYFFVSMKVAAYSGLLLATPFLLYQIAKFVLPGLTVGERRILGPIVMGSGVLFAGGLVFAHQLLIPAALNFFIHYGEGIVD